MTTLIKFENAENSNGDVHITIGCGFAAPRKVTLLPGDKAEEWISTGHSILIQETWPTRKPAAEVKEGTPPADVTAAPSDLSTRGSDNGSGPSAETGALCGLWPYDTT